jgi:DNA-binding MarR family transcriptional regulator
VADGEAGSDKARSRKARAVRAIVFMNRLFEYECRELGLSLSQYRMLLYLRHGPRRAGELAAQASITRPSMSTMIAGLEKQALVARTAVDADRRGVRLELTRKGLAAIARVERRFSVILDDASQGCERERLLLALEELARELNTQVATRARADD